MNFLKFLVLSFIVASNSDINRILEYKQRLKMINQLEASDRIEDIDLIREELKIQIQQETYIDDPNKQNIEINDSGRYIEK